MLYIVLERDCCIALERDCCIALERDCCIVLYWNVNVVYCIGT